MGKVGTPTIAVRERVRPERAARRYRGDIDGLRALAILLVVAYHIGLPGLSGGFIGVDVFFVISGYLITRNLLIESEASGRVDLLSFWARRIRRLVPAMALVVVATLVASLVILPVIEMHDVVEQGAAASLYLSNVLFANQLSHYFGGEIGDSPFLHTWSLGVEEQFYLVWPVVVGVVVGISRQQERWLRQALGVVFAVMLVSSFVISVRLTDGDSPWAFFGLHSRTWEFAAGGLLGVVAIGRALDRAIVRNVAVGAGLALVVGAALLVGPETPYPGTWALLPVTGTVLLILAGSGPSDRTWLRPALESGPTRWLGRVSYSWYLWHWPFIILMAAQFGDELAVRALAGGLSLAVAAVSYSLVEQPVRVSPRLKGSSGRTFALGAALTIGALAVGVGVQQAADRFFTTDLDVMLADALDDKGSRGCVDRPTSPSGIRYCLAGDVESERTVMVIGDSHARHWSVTLDEVGRAEGLRIVGRWLAACPPVAVELTFDATGAAGAADCRAFRADTQQLLAEMQPDAVLVSHAAAYNNVRDEDGGALEPDQQAARWESGYRDLLEGLLARTPNVGLIRDNPFLPVDPVDCVGRERDIDICTPSRTEALARTELLTGVEDEVLGDLGPLPQMTTIDHLCNDTTCSIATDQYLIYSDWGHLTNAYTDSRQAELRQLLRDTLARDAVG